MISKGNVSMAEQILSDATTASRANFVTGKKFANSVVSIEGAPHASRVSLRATAKGAKAFGKSIGLDLPMKPGQTSAKAGKTALWLGPDEWLIIDEKQPHTSMVPRLPNKEFSATDISHRNVAFLLSGEGAVDTLNGGCPRDLSLKAFPLGTASRTIFGKSEVVLFRFGRSQFRLECWRSFAPYVWNLLNATAQDAAL